MSKKNPIFRESSLNRISSPEQLNEYIKIISPNLVLILVSIFSIVFTGFIWMFVSEVPKYEKTQGVVVTERNGGKKLYSYIDIGTSKRLSVGMQARISPNYLPVEEYGYINGEIEKIGSQLIDKSYIYSNFSNPEIFPTHNCVEVITSLKAPSQEKIANMDIVDGSECTLNISTGKQKTIDLVLR